MPMHLTQELYVSFKDDMNDVIFTQLLNHEKNTAFHLSLRVTYNDCQCCVFSCMSALVL